MTFAESVSLSRRGLLAGSAATAAVATAGPVPGVRVLDMLALNRVPLLAYDFPWPAIGYAGKDGEGFRYPPAPIANDALSSGESTLEGPMALEPLYE
jgi:hypothetical protein